MTVFAGSAAGDPGADKDHVDAKIQDLEATAAGQQDRAGVLTEELSAAAGRVRELDSAVEAQETRLAVLANTLTRHAPVVSTRSYDPRPDSAARTGEGGYEVASRRLEQRVHDLYVSDDPDVISVVFETTSFTDLLDNVEILNRIGKQDERIVEQVTATRNAIALARRRTSSARAERLGSSRS